MVKIETVEERQVPRWVFAMMNANKDPTEFSDSPANRFEGIDAARNMHRRRKERLEEFEKTSRISGLEWKHRPRKHFTEKELDKILPGRRVEYVANRAFFSLTVVVFIVLLTLCVVAVGIAVCAEIKLGVSAKQAWLMFTEAPGAYYHHVVNAFDW